MIRGANVNNNVTFFFFAEIYMPNDFPQNPQHIVQEH